MALTSSSGLRYPTSASAPNIPADFQNLASDLDQKVILQVANAAARSALTNKYDGMVVYEQGTLRTFQWNAGGTRWEYIAGPRYTWTPTLQDAGSSTVTATTITTRGVYVIRGGWLEFSAVMRFQGGVNGGAGNLQLNLPTSVVLKSTEPAPYSIQAALFTPVSGQNWVGGGYSIMGTNRVALTFPASATQSNVAEFRNATTAGASGTGVPLIGGSYPLADGARLSVWGLLECDSWPAP